MVERRSFVACTLVLSACGRIAFDPLGGDAAGDGQTGDSIDAVPACAAFGPWSAPQRIAELATTQREYVGQLMPDLQTLYFTRGSSQFVAHRPGRGMPFDPPQQITELGSSGCCLTVRRDELELYFEAGSTPCIFRSVRSSTALPWDPPAMVPQLCAGGATEGAYLTPDGLTLFYNTATPPTDYNGTLMVTTRATTSDAFSTGTPVAGLTGGATKGYPTVSPDGLTIRFESGSPDLFEAQRPSIGAAFGAPAAIPGINTTAADQDNWVSEDGLELLFGSDRLGANDLDLYIATRSCL